MPVKPPPAARAARPYAKHLAFFFAVTIGSVWALTVFYLVDYEFAVGVLGELTLRNPLVVLILHSPAIAALLILHRYDGFRGIANFLRTLVPRRKDLLWLPVLAALMLGYIFAIRYLCILFGIDVPPEPETPLEMLLTFLELFYMEVGMVAIGIGWFGFVLPMAHRLTRNHLTAGIATGMSLAVFVAPGNVLSSFELAIAWPLYAAQLCVLCTGMSMLMSRMKGNVLFFLIPFWVSASGSAMELYYFAATTQFVQLGLFTVLVAVLYAVLKREAAGGELAPRFTFPEYLEREYTVRMGAVLPGVGDKSRESRPEGADEPAPAGADRKEMAG